MWVGGEDDGLRIIECQWKSNIKYSSPHPIFTEYYRAKYSIWAGNNSEQKRSSPVLDVIELHFPDFSIYLVKQITCKIKYKWCIAKMFIRINYIFGNNINVIAFDRITNFL